MAHLHRLTSKKVMSIVHDCLWPCRGVTRQRTPEVASMQTNNETPASMLNFVPETQGSILMDIPMRGGDDLQDSFNEPSLNLLCDPRGVQWAQNDYFWI